MQIFFISPNGNDPVATALQGILGQSYHGWLDAGATQSIGAIEVRPNGNGEQIAAALESAGIQVLPDHRFGVTLPASAVTALARYNVTATDTTASAMSKIHAISGWPPHKARRFS